MERYCASLFSSSAFWRIMWRRRTLFVAAKVPSEAANMAVRNKPKIIERDIIQIMILKLAQPFLKVLSQYAAHPCQARSISNQVNLPKFVRRFAALHQINPAPTPPAKWNL